jgi:parallel beta-helix repeat protein
MGRGLRGVTVIALLIVVLFCGAASADTLTVGSSGCDYTKIQYAVDNASAGYTIFVYNGSYTENVDVDKRLKLRGEGADVVTVTASSSKDHVLEVTADRVNISGFTVTGAKDSGKAGIYLIDADHCDVSENNASGNRCGICLNFSSYNTLSNNTANLNSGYGGYGKRGYGYGIYLNSSSNNILAKNDASSNSGRGTNSHYHDGGDGYGYGIHLCYSSDNTLTSNNASSNIGEGGMGGRYGHNGRGYGYGIYLRYSSNNTLTSNTANSNSYYNYKRYYGRGYGIYLNDSSNNVLYHNNFIDNTHDDALDDCNNTWDDGTEGNYYSDYTGTDLNDDGIGDTAYSIPGDGDNVDNFPLARPWEGHRVSTEVLTVGSSGCDYTKIQDAVDDAEVGDMIVVYNGTYTENVCVDKRLKLRGEGADVVTVRAAREKAVFEVTTDWVSISGFTVIGRDRAGIYLNDADHCVISENNARGNSVGINVWYSRNNTIANNTLNSNGRGIYFTGRSNNNMIKDNTVNLNDKDGIYMYSSHNTLVGNTLNSNYNGIYITDSSNNTLANNTLNSNEYCGIHLHSYSYKYHPLNRYNTLTGNTANSNGKYGIYLDASVGNVVVNNTANSNKDGIHISYVSSINNTIHHNSFADNTQYDAYDSCHDQDYYHLTNTWDNGTEGN